MPREIQVVSLHKIFDDGLHNAFTDLCRFHGQYYVTFRNCPDGHGLYASSHIMVAYSRDTKDWEVTPSFSVPNSDMRGPHFVIFRDTLFVLSGTWLVPTNRSQRRDLNDHQGYGVWSQDGETRQGPRFLEGTQGHYIWRTTVHKGKAYLCGRRKRDFASLSRFEEERAITESALLPTENGFSRQTVGPFQETYGNETAFLFEEDDSILAIARAGVRGTSSGVSS